MGSANKITKCEADLVAHTYSTAPGDRGRTVNLRPFWATQRPCLKEERLNVSTAFKEITALKWL